MPLLVCESTLSHSEDIAGIEYMSSGSFVRSDKGFLARSWPSSSRTEEDCWLAAEDGNDASY